MNDQLTSDQLIVRRRDNGTWSLHAPDAAPNELFGYGHQPGQNASG